MFVHYICFNSCGCCSVVKSYPTLVTPWPAACQAPLSSTLSWSLLKLMSIESVCHPTVSSSPAPFSSCPESFPGSGFLPDSLHQVAKILALQLQHPSNEYSRLVSFRVDWFNLINSHQTFIPSVPALLVEKTILFPLKGLCILVVIQLTIDVRVFLDPQFFSVGMSVLRPILQSLFL